MILSGWRFRGLCLHVPCPRVHAFQDGRNWCLEANGCRKRSRVHVPGAQGLVIGQQWYPLPG